MWAGLGLDVHPELQPMYFGQYRRLVYLAQTDDPDLTARAQAAADTLGLAFERRETGFGDLAPAIQQRHPLPRSLTHGHDDRHLVARHPRPGDRPGRPQVEQDRAPPAVPGRHRQGRQPRRQARLQRLHRGVAQGPARLRRRCRRGGRDGGRAARDRVRQAPPRPAHPVRRRGGRSGLPAGPATRPRAGHPRGPRRHDPHRHQLRHPRGRHRRRPAVRRHRRAHQPDRSQGPRRRDAGRRLQPGHDRHARPGRGRRAHARRQRRHPAGRRARDPGPDHPARPVADRRPAVDRLVHRRGARGRSRGLPGQSRCSTA